MAALGSNMGTWILWEKALIPFLMLGCCNWVGISKKTVEQLDESPNHYVRVKLKTSLSCPKVILRADTVFVGMKHRLWEGKMMYVQLKRLEEKSLA